MKKYLISDSLKETFSLKTLEVKILSNAFLEYV